MKKKLTVLFLSFVMVLSLVGCGNDNEVVNDGTDTTTTQDERDLGDSENFDDGDSVKDDIKNAGDSIKDGIEDTGDAIRNGVNDMTGHDSDKTNE